MKITGSKQFAQMSSTAAENDSLYIDSTKDCVRFKDANGYNINIIDQAVYGRKGSSTAYGSIDIASTATLIRASDADRVTMMLYNNSAVTIYLGTSGVTASGYPLLVGKDKTIEDTNAVYGFVTSGTADLRYIEASQ